MTLLVPNCKLCYVRLKMEDPKVPYKDGWAHTRCVQQEDKISRKK